MTNRRDMVPFDPDYFARRAASGEDLSVEATFRHAYESRLWCGPESVSGHGAGFDQTAAIRRALPALLSRLDVCTLLDLPCGDHHWMRHVDLESVDYIGAELLAELVAENTRRYASPRREFRVLDLLTSTLPAVDLLLCRDCLVHLSFDDISRATANVRRAGPTYLLTTTFPDQHENVDIHTGDWRPLNLRAAPFHWPAPLELVNEHCTEGGGLFADKSLGLWRVRDLPAQARSE